MQYYIGNAETVNDTFSGLVLKYMYTFKKKK